MLKLRQSSLRGMQQQCTPSIQRQLPQRCGLLRAAAAPEASTSDSSPAYPYNGEDTRQKATIEHVFRPVADDDLTAETSTSSTLQTPWSVGWQMNERNLVWSDDLKLRLIKHIAAQELGVPESELEQRLREVEALLPGLGPQLVRAPPRVVAQLAANTTQVAERLVALKLIFPEADLTTMVSKRMSLLLEDDVPQVGAAAARLRQLLPTIHTDYFVEAHPSVLDIEDFERALEDAKRIMPGMDVVQMLRQNPDLVLSLQKGKNLIPYDQIDNPWS